MVAGRSRLFVGRFVFLVDDDEAEIRQTIEAVRGWQREDGSFWRSNRPYDYDNIPYYRSERYLRFPLLIPHMAGIFAMAAMRTAETDPDLSARCLEAAEKNEATIPMERVMAKPRTGPVPNWKRIRAVIKVVRFASTMAVRIASLLRAAASACNFSVRSRTSPTNMCLSPSCMSEIARSIGADHLLYQDLPDLVEAASEGNRDITGFCTACFTGTYPTGDVTDETLCTIEADRRADFDGDP